MSKYPFIPDKRMYAAVMGACKYIRERGYFNKAISYYADKYDVDSEELAKHIRARQAAGQKGRKSASTGKKYHYFICCETVWCEANGETAYMHPSIERGLSKETVMRRMSAYDWERTCREDYGGSYAPVYGHEVLAQYDSEEEAKRHFSEWESLVPARR